MDLFYTNEKNTLSLIGLLKAHGIRKVIASPGTTNMCFVASIQQDPFFELYSSVDERSAAYLACGIAAESGEAVVLSCTGATASRNYMSGLTEAFYRKLPVLAVTSTQHRGRIGNNMQQIVDRSVIPNDIARISVQIPIVQTEEDRWASEVLINRAILELRHHGGGPAHIDLTTKYSTNYSIKELPTVQAIRRVENTQEFPQIPKGKIGIFVGAHKYWDERLTSVIDKFCEKYNAVVFADWTSNYQGKYGVNPYLVCKQKQYVSACKNMDLLIHIGDVSCMWPGMKTPEVWRVNPDGAVSDTFRKLSYVFEMEEYQFFEKCVKDAESEETRSNYFNEWREECCRVEAMLSELPFSNSWIAQKMRDKLPVGSCIHFGILNSLRSWDFLQVVHGIDGFSNTGGFGIDGCLSSLLGASIVNTNRLYFGVIGDLSFFYDMNALGNRHIKNNVRLLVINNGRGTEFRNYGHKAYQFGESADPYIAAAGHYGNKSKDLVKHYATDLGYKYLCASDKEEFLRNIDEFMCEDLTEQSMVFEVFTNPEDESETIEMIYNLVQNE